MNTDELLEILSNQTIQNKLTEYTGIKKLVAEKVFGGITLGYSDSSNLPPQILKSIDILHNLYIQLTYYKEKYTTFDYNLINNLFHDLSLSLIFGNDVFDENQEKYGNLINDLKNIGAKSYEGKAVDIGVIYCPDYYSFKQLKQLNIDIIELTEKKAIKELFDNEKPFLRLIDNESFAIIIDSTFNVTALARKKKSEKSINYIIEKQFTTYVTNKTHNELLDIYIKKIESLYEAIKDDERLEKIKGLYFEMTKDINNRPNYLYFSLKMGKINIYTKKDFVLTYFNGDWKLKPYNLINGVLANYLFEKNLHTLVFDNDDEESKIKIFNNLMDSIEFLSETLKRLSLSSTSTIFLINWESEFFKLINQNNENSPPMYLKAISSVDDTKQLNIKDIDYYSIKAISSVDGAVLLDPRLNILDFGATVNMTGSPDYQKTFGTGTKAARYASRNCLAIKISEDGDIYFFQQEELLAKI
ncbi:hypothetical protein [Bacillus subtilis]|uniref:hypothetical protein n=3 Tax=Bacillus subtilis TaxID=1423 RepID=UPI0004A5A1E0|nr:hypothetical protein [Bacillus subtilis]PAE69806.1 hypothetical protein CHH85_00180 [Bacillus subtilis]WJF86837.1 hypothetical protein QSU94_20915 [Bacillus subtilis]CCU56851.1 hypothetical protein BSUBE1_0220 [Bacillus subtilis E1]